MFHCVILPSRLRICIINGLSLQGTSLGFLIHFATLLASHSMGRVWEEFYLDAAKIRVVSLTARSLVLLESDIPIAFENRASVKPCSFLKLTLIPYIPE